MTANTQDAIVLLGDSLTEFGFSEGGFAAKLANAYIRKLDVINRGFSGYNTDWILPVFEQCFPTQEEQQRLPKIRLLTIWFGANDAALPPNPQHIPLARYKSNLAQLVRAITSPDSPRYSPDTRILLITPPPADGPRWARFLAAQSEGTETPAWAQKLAAEHGWEALQKPDRGVEVSGRYAAAAREVGAEEGVAVVDAWTALWEAAGKDEKGLEDLLVDGLHLSDKGYKIVYDGIVSTIAEKYPEYHYDNLQTVFATYEPFFENPGDYQNITKKRSAFKN
ncbi:SGNH hydrolase [Trametes sanguinea]|nr:SGNH hydrolase [Trametes sanguinea]